MSSIKTVALLGADGKLGPHILKALAYSGFFTVTVLKRESSKSPDAYPSGVKVAKIPDDFNEEALTTILKGQDAIVVTIPGTRTDLQKKLANAAVAAGVKRFIPADFGSCDSESTRARELVPLYVEKTKMREYLQSLAAKHDGFTWTSLVTGHFFDHDLKWMHINVKERRVDALDDGLTKWSTCSMSQIGRATTKVLEKADDKATQNTTLYVQSFCVTQKDVAASLQRLYPDDKVDIKYINSDAFTKEEKKKSDAGDKDATEEVVWVLGTLEAFWEDRPTFANKLLGLEEENIDEVLSRAAKALGA